MKCKYCNSDANFPPKTKYGGWCCVESFYKCPGYRQKLKDTANPWSKGLTKETDSKLLERSVLMKGKKFGSFVSHTDETKQRIAKTMRGNNNAKHRGDRQSYYNNIRMDSSWEVKVAEYLDQNNIKWKYGKTVFNIDEKRSYRPDFELENGTFIEVKGYWRKENLAKFNDFKKAHPQIVVDIWDKTKLKALKII